MTRGFLHSLTMDGDSFGPGVDLIVSLVAVLVIMLTINTNAYKKELVSIERVSENQLQVIHEIAEKHNTIPVSIDPRPTNNSNRTNLDLASRRAIAVFYLLQELGISPETHIMSATSFGEYVPVQRDYSDTNYNSEKLDLHNDTPEKQEPNRRIEVVLTYRQLEE